MNVYLAGPDVFFPDAVEMGHRKKALCVRYGLVGVFPIDGEGGDTVRSHEIFRANTRKMDGAAAIVANLTPFRGPSADPGTVYELGYMAGRGKVCLGYSNDPRPYAARARAWEQQAEDPSHRSSAGFAIENFELSDNLMLIHGLETFGHALVVAREEPADYWRDLTAFEACVRLAAQMLLRERRAV